MLTLNGLLGHRRELGVEFLSVHHAKPRVEGVFALGRTLISQDTRIWATTQAANCSVHRVVPDNRLRSSRKRAFGAAHEGFRWPR